jgi:anti-sigma factor RsiW
MTTPEQGDGDHAVFEAKLSDLVDGALSAEEARAVEEHAAGCDRCRSAIAELRETKSALSGLNRVPAPQNFDREVAETIRRRSRGRFFGRRAFGDRVPLELLAIFALALGFVAYLVIRSSATGSMRYEREPDRPKIHRDAPDVVPRP